VLEAFEPDLVLPDRVFRPALRVRELAGCTGVFEVTWGIRRRAASAVVAETLDRVLNTILATAGDDRVLAAIRRQAERMSAASG
jgi:hypothetical protein